MTISSASDTLHMLAVVGLELWHAHLIGGAPPSSTRRYNRMKELRPGDLVIELSTSGFWRKQASMPGASGHVKVENAIGFLDRITREPFPVAEGDEPWDEVAEGRPEPLEEVFYIRRLDGEYKGDEAIFRWTNASFVTILPKEGWKGLMEE